MQELPIRGPRVYIAIADARSRSTKRSPILPPPHAMGALPARPARRIYDLIKVDEKPKVGTDRGNEMQ